MNLSTPKGRIMNKGARTLYNSSANRLEKSRMQGASDATHKIRSGFSNMKNEYSNASQTSNNNEQTISRNEGGY